MKNILLLVHENDSGFALGQPGYLMELLMKEWERGGIDVRVARGVDHLVPADTLIPHLDLTAIPPDYLAFMQKYPRVVNAYVRDTSKSRISTSLLEKDDDYVGAVIVKTDRNYGGLPETYLAVNSGSNQLKFAAAIRKIAIRACKKLTGSSPWRYVDHLNPSEYPIFPSLGVVPRGVFKNRNLVVEKYVPEVDGDDYLLRYYYFFGNREICLLLRSKEKVVKFSNAFQIEEIPVHPALRRIRHKFGFDYGKFDYFVHDDEVIVFDVNKTPGHTAGHAEGKYEDLYHKLVCHLAGGIDSVLDGTYVNTSMSSAEGSLG
ncbi:MAG: hypothetical protein ABIU96_13320 [Rhodanobacter sp.]